MAGSKKAKKQEPATETFDLGGSSVVISRLNDREIVQIDGRIVGYYKTPDGYLLKGDVYRRPAKTLREAVERHLTREGAQ